MKILHGINLSSKQIDKKIQNIKHRMKTKIDMKKTGNCPKQKLTVAETKMFEMLDGIDNPSIAKLPCMCSTVILNLLFYIQK